MSLILEALKKSERQRRLGESPSLGSPVMAVRRRRSLLPVLALLIVVGLAALWWLRRDSQPAESAADVAANAPAASATTATPVPAAPAATAPAAAPAARPQQKPALPNLALDGQAEQQEKIRSGERVVANSEGGAAATVKESEPVSAADPAALAAAMNAAAKPPVAPERKKAIADAPASPPVESATKAVAPIPAPAPGVAAAPGLKLMWELPLATRRSLPEIKLSMHVFAAEPAQRFVILNDERRAEGDEFDDLKLVEIRNDGIVFEHEGVRFLYPRGGR